LKHGLSFLFVLFHNEVGFQLNSMCFDVKTDIFTTLNFQSVASHFEALSENRLAAAGDALFYMLDSAGHEG